MVCVQIACRADLGQAGTVGDERDGVVRPTPTALATLAVSYRLVVRGRRGSTECHRPRDRPETAHKRPSFSRNTSIRRSVWLPSVSSITGEIPFLRK